MSAKEGGSLRAYVLKRLLQLIPLIVIMAVINFTLIHAAPGSPIIYLVGEAGASEELIALYEKALGLDKSLPEQLGLYMINILRGDLGYSYFYQKPVLEVIVERLPNTILLMGTQFIIFAIVGIFSLIGII